MNGKYEVLDIAQHHVFKDHSELVVMEVYIAVPTATLGSSGVFPLGSIELMGYPSGRPAMASLVDSPRPLTTN